MVGQFSDHPARRDTPSIGSQERNLDRATTRRLPPHRGDEDRHHVPAEPDAREQGAPRCSGLSPSRKGWVHEVRAVQDVLGGGLGYPEAAPNTAGEWAALARRMLDHRGAASILSMEFLSLANPRRARRVLRSLEGPRSTSSSPCGTRPPRSRRSGRPTCATPHGSPGRTTCGAYAARAVSRADSAGSPGTQPCVRSCERRTSSTSSTPGVATCRPRGSTWSRCPRVRTGRCCGSGSPASSESTQASAQTLPEPGQ